MNGKCLDIGTIQAFLDGEITPDVSLRLSEHIANCADCANLLAVAEDENSFVFSTLEREMNTLVPTQRLWNRINDSIEIEKANVSVWHQFVAFVSTSFSSPTLTTAVGALIVFGFVAAIWTFRSPAPAPTPQDVARKEAPGDLAQPTLPENLNIASAQERGSSIAPVPVSNLSDEKLGKLVQEANEANRIRPQYLVHQPLPGEVGYIKTIAGLKESLDGRRDEVFDVSSRVAFERDLAVVNNAIQRTQKVARKNPQNQAARQVLYSAYQDKIDLLNTVAQRDELMASTR